MVTRRDPTPRRVPPADPNRTAGVPVPDDNPHADTPGHPQAHGTLPMARHLTDPATEAEIQALAAEAPLPTVDQAARLARLLRLNRSRRADAA